jgi:BarA-like signal transduction histidine kinase
LKPYRFIEDQTLQLVLVKPNDFLSKEPMEVKYSNNLQHVEETHFDNMSDDELV